MNVKRSVRCLQPLLLAAGLSGCAFSADAPRAPAAPATGTFDHLDFSNTNGRVGYHMYSSIAVYDYDTPTGSASSCHPGANDTTTSGTIPPGLTLLANDLPNNGGLHGFDGTPRQPGDWTVRVMIGHIMCQSDPNHTDYGPKTVVVNFHIAP